MISLPIPDSPKDGFEDVIGTDNDDLYTFARFDSAVPGLTWRFR